MNALFRGFAAEVLKESKNEGWCQPAKTEWPFSWGGAVEQETDAPFLKAMQPQLPAGRKPAIQDKHELDTEAPASMMTTIYEAADVSAMFAAQMFAQMYQLSQLIVPTPDEQFEEDAELNADTAAVAATKVQPRRKYMHQIGVVHLQILTDYVVR